MKGKMEKVNCHMHLVNFEFIPDTFFKAQSIVSESFMKSKWNRFVARKLFLFHRNIKFKYTMDVVDLLVQSIDNVAKRYIQEMDEAGILIATPLMMDFEIGAHYHPEIPYLRQIELVAQVCAKYKGRLLPFINIDPRRKEATKLAIYALSELGFMGVKLYPPLGYCIDPDSIYNIRNNQNRNLHELYTYCERGGIPITTHCSKNGAYSNDLVKYKEFGDYLSHPKHVIRILRKYPKLRINLAHFGGDLFSFDNKNSWSRRVLWIIEKYQNAYADLSCQFQSFDTNTQGDFQKTIQKVMQTKVASKKVILGTDWPIAAHTWSEKSYIQCLGKVIGDDYHKILTNNPLDFLFGSNTQLPERILNYYKKHHIVPDERVVLLIKNNSVMVKE